MSGTLGSIPLLAQGGEGFVRNRESGSGASCVSDDGVCPAWIVDHFDRYMEPLGRHVLLTVVALAIGFSISFTLALLAHRRRWLIAPVVQLTGILYTIPSLALFFLLLPITGRGFLTAEIALVSYTLLIIFRNVVTGLDGVPSDVVDAARGMGLNDRQVLWRVEIPLALPEIAAGLRIAATTTVGLASLAFFAGAGGLGDPIYADLNFKSNVLVAGGLCVLLAIALDLLVLAVQRLLTPWTRAVPA